MPSPRLAWRMGRFNFAKLLNELVVKRNCIPICSLNDLLNEIALWAELFPTSLSNLYLIN